jgi:17beta-estradiol 17-dehydrogenase / very-long-chain 3-oxoacyl-CoA reductase
MPKFQGMVEKKRGIIVNLASAAGRKPLHLNNVYSATKAYCDFFSRYMLVLNYRLMWIFLSF